MSKVLKRMKGAFLRSTEEVAAKNKDKNKKEEKEMEKTKKDEAEVKKVNKPSEEELSFAQLEAEVENRRRDKIQAAEKEAEKELKELESIKEREELENKLRKEVEEEIYREEFKKSYKEKLLKKMAEEKAEKTKTNTVEEKIVVTEITPAEEAVSDNNTQAEEDQAEEVKAEKKPSPVALPSKKAAKGEVKEKDFFILTNGRIMKKSSLDNKLKKLGNKKVKVNYSIITKFKVVISGKKFFIINGELGKNAKVGGFFSPIAEDFLSKAQVEVLKEIDPEEASSYIQVEGIYAIVSEGGFEKEVEIKD